MEPSPFVANLSSIVVISLALISFYCSHYKYSLEKAVEISQKDIYELIEL